MSSTTLIVTSILFFDPLPNVRRHYRLNLWVKSVVYSIYSWRPTYESPFFSDRVIWIDCAAHGDFKTFLIAHVILFWWVRKILWNGSGSSTMLLNIVRASSEFQWSKCESLLMPKGSQSLHITLLFEGKTLIENLSSYSTKIPLRIQETILSR